MYTKKQALASATNGEKTAAAGAGAVIPVIPYAHVVYLYVRPVRPYTPSKSEQRGPVEDEDDTDRKGTRYTDQGGSG